MRGVSALFGEAQSLRRRLVVNILLALVFCLALLSAILTYEFYEHLAENRENALAQEVFEIAAEIAPAEHDLGFDALAPRFQGDGGIYRYTILDGALQPLVGSETVANLQDRIAGSQPGDIRFWDLGSRRTAASLVVERNGRRFVILASTALRPSSDAQLSELLHEIMEALHWVVIGIAAVLAAAILAASRALAPIRRVSEEARAIGPGSADRRLSTQHLPTEILPLVHAVNEAFDRLDQGYRAQRDFSSNVAHEVRTPIAVLRSTIDRMEDGPLQRDLRRDVQRLEQLFEQLIDLSRAEALGVTAFADVDLRRIALSVAEEMGVPALRAGMRLAVTGVAQRRVRGHAGLLGIALGNLVRNAVHYTDDPGEIEIEICEQPAGWRVLDRGPGIPDDQKGELFQRFRRGGTGRRDGAGIGLAIVTSVAEAHGATVGVTDREGGGSVFSFRFGSE